MITWLEPFGGILLPVVEPALLFLLIEAPFGSPVPDFRTIGMPLPPPDALLLLNKRGWPPNEDVGLDELLKSFCCFVLRFFDDAVFWRWLPLCMLEVLA